MASSSSPEPETPLSSATLVASNDDLLTKILLGLPTRPLLRSKSVSKHWLTLITHRTFSVLRRKRLGPIPSGLFLQPLHRHLTSDYRFLPLDGSPLPITPPFRTLSFFNDEATIVRSCNGLLLCCESRTGPGMKCYVYNPTSGRFDALTTDGFWIDDMCLAFNPSKSQNYKVIAVRVPDSQIEGWRIDIYSSETGSWLDTGVHTSLFDHYCDFRGGLYWNGAVHWVSEERKSFYFDIDRQVLVELSLPPELERCRHREITYFGESNNHLHLVAGAFPFFSPQFDVY